jgi:hypothetical protein
MRLECEPESKTETGPSQTQISGLWLLQPHSAFKFQVSALAWRNTDHDKE